MAPLVWFITGTSSGFGRELTRTALARGDKVIATARAASKIEDLKAEGADVITCDITAGLPKLKEVAKEAVAIHGRVDVLVNNAGYAQDGNIEELTPEETQAQFDTNVFGTLNVTRAFLPYMRAQRSGVIANISSVGAWRGSPGCGMYCASKWALTALSESLKDEVAEFGIKVCVVEPGYFRSNFLSPGNKISGSNLIEEYAGTAGRKTQETLVSYDNKQPGDIKKGAKVIVDVLTGKEGEVPKRLLIGSDCIVMIETRLQESHEWVDRWRELGSSTDHDDVQK